LLASHSATVHELRIFIPAVCAGDDFTQTDNLTAARAGRVTRVGSRLGRIIRMVRLVRLAKLYSLLVEAQAASNAANSQQNTGNVRFPTFLASAATNTAGRGLDTSTVRQSKVGSRLSDYTTRRVIVGVLLMLLVVPLLTFEETDFSEQVGARTVHEFNVRRYLGWEAAASNLRVDFQKWETGIAGTHSERLVRLFMSPLNASDAANALLLDLEPVYSDLRDGFDGLELIKFEYSEASAALGGAIVTTQAWFNHRPLLRENAAYSIGLTVFIILLLGLASLQFTSDAQALVLRPLESMVAFVEDLAVNPLKNISSKDNTGLFETKVLENSIKKIAGLLRLGLGDSGTLVVSRHLKTHPPVDEAAEAVYQRALAASALLNIAKHPPTRRERYASAASQSAHLADGPALGSAVPDAHQEGAIRASVSSKQSNTTARPASGLDESVGAGFFDAQVEGRNVRAIFMRVRLRDAQAIRTVLGRRYLPFLNTIANIVHDTCLAWGGAPHSNLHDGWQCMWVIDDEWLRLQAEEHLKSAQLAPTVAVNMETNGSAASAFTQESTVARVKRSLSLAAFAQGRGAENPNMKAPTPANMQRPRVVSEDSETSSENDSSSSSDGDGSGSDASEDSANLRRRRAKNSKRSRRKTVAATPSLPDSSVDGGRHSRKQRRTRGSTQGSFGSPLDTLAAREHTGDSEATPPSTIDDAIGVLGTGTVGRNLGLRVGALLRKLTAQQKLSAAAAVADKALVTAAKILVQLQRSEGLRTSYEVGKLKGILPSFEPQLDIAIHAGWAVQGAIGSQHKVDIAYLSPDATVTRRLQSVSGLYGAAIVLTAAFYGLLPSVTRQMCRKLDVVSFTDRVPDFPRPGKPSPISRAPPMALYSYDAWSWNTPISKHLQLMTTNKLLASAPDPDIFTTCGPFDLTANARRISVLGAADIIEHPVHMGKYLANMFASDNELRSLRAPFASRAFQRLFAQGVALYLAGRWQAARDVLVQLLRVKQLPLPAGDRPTRALLDFMARFGFRAPRGWKSFRLLGPR